MNNIPDGNTHRPTSSSLMEGAAAVGVHMAFCWEFSSHSKNLPVIGLRKLAGRTEALGGLGASVGCIQALWPLVESLWS